MIVLEVKLILWSVQLPRGVRNERSDEREMVGLRRRSVVG